MTAPATVRRTAPSMNIAGKGRWMISSQEPALCHHIVPFGGKGVCFSFSKKSLQMNCRSAVHFFIVKQYFK
jgi:hypothetical protein